MDSEAKVEQFCLLAKSVKGIGLVDLIQKATAEPELFAFGELLAVPSVKELVATEHRVWYELLELFAYGTWPDYKAAASKYPELSEPQQNKLKQLTVVSLASTRKTLPYDVVMEKLEMTNLRQFEDFLITDCFYPGLVDGKLDQKQRCLHVYKTFGRDVHPSQLGNLLQSLSTWVNQIQTVMTEIEDKVKWAQTASEEAEERQAKFENEVDEVKKVLKAVDPDFRAGIHETLLNDEVAGDLMEEDRMVSRPKRRR